MQAGRDVVERLRAWAADHFGGEVTVATPPEADTKGFDSEIWFLRLAGAALPEPWRAPLVLRIKSDVGQLDVAHREAAIQDWAADRGFPVPRVLAVLDPGTVSDRPVQVLERAPGVIALDAVLKAPWRAPSLVRRLARLQARLHQIDPDGFPAGEDLFDKRLRLTRATLDQVDHPPMRDALTRVEELAGELRDAPPAVCHGDFHPLNVLVDGDDMSVIDWTDAGVGDRHGDVARTLVLFDVAAIAAGNRVERIVLRVAGPVLGRIYRRAYERVLPLDDRRLACWTPVHLLHGWSQAVGVTAGVFDGDGAVSAATGRVDDDLAEALRLRFEQTMAELR